jgi:hypothetical protein
VSIVDPDSPEWAEWVPQLAGKRLNAAGTAEEVAQRWASSCTLVHLVPVDEVDPLPDASGAAPPRPSTATRLPRRPFRLHRVRKPR